MNFKEIQELIKMVGESNLTTVEIENESFRIMLRKEEKTVITEKLITGSSYPGLGVQAAVSSTPLGSTVSTGIPAPTTGSQTTPVTEEARPAQNTIKSPIVGTFYASSSPGAAPFVQPGSRVTKGDTLCIIEAMKLMNEIEAEEDYQILEVLVKDGDMVEYGQVLFAVGK